MSTRSAASASAPEGRREDDRARWDELVPVRAAALDLLTEGAQGLTRGRGGRAGAVPWRACTGFC
ncbi:hypothetical protein [Streptomyces sp. KHY 26]|uniref:hypothetical protein n=1 Tax=Streptomyces sp. KHY 26 TaxID=3097359 RepID=UPI00376EF19E